jgi:hypothetical protein
MPVYITVKTMIININVNGRFMMDDVLTGEDSRVYYRKI